MGKIKEMMKQELELRGLSELTQIAYLACPDQLDRDAIHTYQLHIKLRVESRRAQQFGVI